MVEWCVRCCFKEKIKTSKMEKFEKGKGKGRENVGGADGACVIKELTKITEYSRFLWLVLDIDIHSSNHDIFFLIFISYCVHKEFWKTSYRISVTGRDSNITGLRRMKERAFDFLRMRFTRRVLFSFSRTGTFVSLHLRNVKEQRLLFGLS